mmetsp:Transcript_12284/g.23305  ORF Transcript_12284/g.23305 Transcript_12284/m.23305 type:complete len:201 (-) Transcript_12284:563-1165(-)
MRVAWRSRGCEQRYRAVESGVYMSRLPTCLRQGDSPSGKPCGTWCLLSASAWIAVLPPWQSRTDGSPVLPHSVRKPRARRPSCLHVGVEEAFGHLVNLIHGFVRNNALYLALGFVVGHHGHAGLDKHFESLANGFDVIIRASLIAPQKPLLHHRLRAVKEEHEFAVIPHLTLESGSVLSISREAVNQELVVLSSQHRIRE